MTQPLYTPDQAATLLGLHVKTVRRYIREGRLDAVRVGKGYRIAAADLEAFAGIAAPDPSTPHAEASSIVEIDGVDRDFAQRIINGLHALGGARGSSGKLRIETVYSEDRRRLKIVCLGNLGESGALLGLVAAYVENGTDAQEARRP